MYTLVQVYAREGVEGNVEEDRKEDIVIIYRTEGYNRTGCGEK